MAAWRWILGLRSSLVVGFFPVVLAVASAHAATPVFVDAGGLCAGQTPCFTTIQEGINEAGPAPAVVNVFPGSYAESVDLSLMGSAIGGSPGDLVLRTVDGAGVPTPETASILPAAGNALRTSVPPFPGDLTINGFTVQSPDSTGISLVVEGDLMLVRVVADGNGSSGLTLQIEGNVTIIGSSFSDHADGFGMSISGATDVRFERVTADGNDNFNASLSLGGMIHITESSFSESVTNFGLSFSGATEAILDRVTANGNDNFNASFSLNGMVRITDSSFNDSVDNFGLSFSSATDAVLTRVVANGNHNFNASFSLTGEVRIVDSTFNGSTGNFGLSFSNPTQAVLDGVTANDNNNFNASFSVMESIRITNSSFNGSMTNNGLSFAAPVNAFLAAVVAEGNAINGVSMSAQNAEITGSRFASNQNTGVRLSAVQASGHFRLRCNDFIENQVAGLELSSSASVNAEQNYWGAASGPTHPSNPTGTGDAVVDGANGGAGTVDFVPFLTEPTAESSICHSNSAPALGGIGLSILLLALFVLPACRLSRRFAA